MLRNPTPFSWFINYTRVIITGISRYSNDNISPAQLLIKCAGHVAFATYEPNVNIWSRPNMHNFSMRQIINFQQHTSREKWKKWKLTGLVSAADLYNAFMAAEHNALGLFYSHFATLSHFNLDELKRICFSQIDYFPDYFIHKNIRTMYHWVKIQQNDIEDITNRKRRRGKEDENEEVADLY